MNEDTVAWFSHPDRISIRDPLTEVLRAGARRLLADAVEAEVEAFVEGQTDLLDDDGRRRVVRHGHLPERSVQTGIGPVAVRRPRVRDRRPEGAGGRIRFFFLQAYGAKYDKAAACLAKDRDRLLTFYDFPAEHWKHVRSTDEMDKVFFVRGILQLARATSWRSAAHRLKAPPGRLIRALPA